MPWIDIEQNTDEWLDMKTGKLSGSSMSKVMANYGKSFGEPAKKLAVTIAREQVTGKRSLVESYSNPHMERGHEQEPIARALYQDQTFLDVTNGGFFDNGNTGCSPDGCVYNEGLIEIKSVIDHVHYSNIKRAGIDPAYKWQIFFNLMESKREWIDFVSYCADFPEKTQLFIYRVHAKDCADEFNMIKVRKAEFFTEVEKAKVIISG